MPRAVMLTPLDGSNVLIVPMTSIRSVEIIQAVPAEYEKREAEPAPEGKRKKRHYKPEKFADDEPTNGAENGEPEEPDGPKVVKEAVPATAIVHFLSGEDVTVAMPASPQLLLDMFNH